MTTRKDIENALMRGADTLRDTIDAANYKDYVLPVMFLKYLSDSYADAVEALSEQYSGIRLERQKKYLPFMVAEGCSFYDLYKQRFADNIGQLINAAMRQIEADNNQQLAGVFIHSNHRGFPDDDTLAFGIDKYIVGSQVYTQVIGE